MSLSAGSSAPRIQVFRPTMEQFKHFSKYIEHIESTGAHKAGLAKIIPPEGWIPRKRGYDDVDIMIPHPICQIVTGSQGLYQQLNISQKGLTAKEFRKLAESRKFKTPPHFDYEDLERKYWKNITYNSPIYGADVSGSLYDDGVEEFNIQRLNTILDLVKEDYEIQIEGVNTAYLYFGMWKTTFAWHTEDMDLYSINYVHFGAPKSWYVIPPEHGRRLERLAAGFFHGSHSECPAFLRHKMTIISPHILKKYSIPFSKITQEPGEFMITFPYAYHSGFNHGFNIAESTNFALPRWVEYGKRSFPCTCRNDCVKICMDVFIKKYQPDRYELWKIGRDVGAHPEDPSRQYAAPAPKKTDLALSAQRERRRMREMQRIKRHPVSKMNDSEEKSKNNRSKITITESDEETRVYDINEVMAHEEPKKRGRKRSKSNKVNVKRMKKTEEAGGDIIVKNEMKMEHEVKMEVDIVPHLKHEVITDEEKFNVEAQPDISTENKASETPNENVDILVSGNVCNSSNNDGMSKEKREDMPPELTPFWDPDVIKNEENKKIISFSNSKISYNSKVKLLQSYPNLYKAVSAGAFAVVPLNSSNICTKTGVESLSNQDAGSLQSNTSQLSCPIFSPTWRCEQTNNGLKIKFVQPKKLASSILSPVALQTPLKSFEISKGTSAESSVTPQTPVQSVNASHQAKVNNEGNNQSSSDKSICKSKKPLKKTFKSNKLVKKTIKSKKLAKKLHNKADIKWAQPLENLWQCQPKNFEAEIAFNERLAAIPPHCAVCVLFSPLFNSTNFPSEPAPVPSYSAVKMPAFCYGKSHHDCMIDTNSLIKMDGTAPLLTCSQCKVCVHAPCYGISMLPMNPWLCTRCSNNAIDAECCLCVLRGGVLKPTTDGRWAHMVCTILIGETYFENISKKQPANVASLENRRTHLKCKYCFQTLLFKKLKGACVQCLSGKCFLPYHVTCGYMAGVIFEISDWPNPIHMICTKHVAARRKPPRREFTSVSVGDFVIAKHKKNTRYYWVEVLSKYFQEYYSIVFEDNSHSNNTFPEDIVSRDVTIHGTPELNEKVQVKWSDGKIYNGMFKGSHEKEVYDVEFADKSISVLGREEFYAADEDIPKSVQSKVSHASERRTINFDSEPGAKRMRTTNYKYS